MKSDQAREWMWVIGVAGLVVTVSTLPYLAGYLAQTEALRFGGAVLDQVDYHSRLATMWQGYRGSWQFQFLFTPEAHAGAYIQMFYVALGHLARLTGLSLPATYELARLGFGFLVLLIVYRFIAHFIEPVRTRRVAFLLATTASGLGWLTEARGVSPTPPGGVSPIDFWLLDAYTYLSVLSFPHFSAAISLLLIIYLLVLKRPGGPSWRAGGLAVLASLLLGLIHAFDLLQADLVPLLYWGFEGLRTRRIAWRGFATLAAMGVVQAPLLVYNAWVFRTQPVFAGWVAQNVTLSPPPPAYLAGYGLLLALSAIGVVVWIRQGRQGVALPLIWIGLVGVLVYLPWNLQRRFLEGVQVPLGLLAGVGLAEGLLPQSVAGLSGQWRRLALPLLIALAAMSHLVLTASLTVAAAARAPAMFWPTAELAGIDWLGEHTAPQETTLAAFETGNLIPARIGHRVVLGHWIETVDYERKQAAVAQFFTATTPDEERLRLLEQYDVAYVFHGPRERALGNFDPAQAGYLHLVFTRHDVSIYQVVMSQTQAVG